MLCRGVPGENPCARITLRLPDGRHPRSRLLSLPAREGGHACVACFRTSSSILQRISRVAYLVRCVDIIYLAFISQPKRRTRKILISSFVSRLLVGGCAVGPGILSPTFSQICSAAGASKAAIGLDSFCFSSHSLDMTSRPNRFFQGLKLNPIGVSSVAQEQGSLNVII
jgi:hypothetical protein